jgi:hypothetical protein
VVSSGRKNERGRGSTRTFPLLPQNRPRLDGDTFLSALYVFSDDFVQTQAPISRPGPAPALRGSPVLTRLVVAQWRRFASTRALYRYAQGAWRRCFPTRPERSPLVRPAPRCFPLLEGWLREPARQTGAAPYQRRELPPVRLVWLNLQRPRLAFAELFLG